MKRKIIVLRNNEEIYKGKALNLPIKEEFIIKKSIELFDDEEPCIIHQSYIIKEYVNMFLDLFESEKEMNGNEQAVNLFFLDFEKIEDLTFKILG